LWTASQTGSYHIEYGFSCMGYEIAGGLGVKMADPSRQVTVMVGDGSYLMMNSEIATSVAMGVKLVILVLDNRGFGCINRLQAATGGAPFNNLWKDSWSQTDIAIDFAAHARALGADSCHVDHIAALETALIHARQAIKTQVIVIDTDPQHSTSEGGNWWDVAVPEHSCRQDVQQARSQYETSIKNRHAQ
jgi:3D-(3,5/4)-trihydroxycyclohexane-1,2-dione acylhydrolase (decyclizing)